MSATIQKLPEIKILISAADLIAPEVQRERDNLLAQATEIKSVANAYQDIACGLSVTSMRKHVKDLTTERMKRTKILDDAKKLIMDFFGEHTAPLEIEIERLKKIGNNFDESERARVAKEEENRQEEFQKAQAAQFALDDAARKAAESGNLVQTMLANRKLEAAKAATQAVINTPEPEAARAKGKTTKQVLKWELLDIFELVKARPDLCKIEAKASAINSSCHPNHPIPGLKLWFENQSTYTTR